MPAPDRAGRTRQTAAVFRGITGQDIPDYTAEQPDTRGMLQFLFPSGNTAHPVATRTAAERLGVSQRTVQKWLRGDQAPRPESAQQIRVRVRQSVTTQRGRAQLARRLQAPSRARVIRVSALQGPSPDVSDGDYVRDRYSNLEMTPLEQQQMYDAWVRGGDTGVEDYLTGLYNQPGRYVDGWAFHGIKSMNLLGL